MRVQPILLVAAMAAMLTGCGDDTETEVGGGDAALAADSTSGDGGAATTGAGDTSSTTGAEDGGATTGGEDADLPGDTPLIGEDAPLIDDVPDVDPPDIAPPQDIGPQDVPPVDVPPVDVPPADAGDVHDEVVTVDPKVCGVVELPTNAELCGPNLECKMLTVDEVDPDHFRNRAPAIALDDEGVPHVLFSIAEGGYHGYLAKMTPTGWDVAETPMPVTYGGLVGGGGSLSAVIYDGAFGVTHWEHAGGGWSLKEELEGADGGAFAGHLFKDDAGCLHAGILGAAGSKPGYAHRGDFWTYDVETTENSAGLEAALAVTGDGDPHLLWWGGGASGWAAMWRGPDGTVETVSPYNSGSLESNEQPQGIALVGDTPHVVLGRRLADGSGTEVVHGTRMGPDAWQITPITSVPWGDTCSGEPADGEICHLDFWELRPLGIVSSGNGDVRAFYGKEHVTGTLKGKCEFGGPPGPPPMCLWETVEYEVAPEIHVAWADGQGGMATAEVSTESNPLRISLLANTDGRIHAAAYSRGTDGTKVHYLYIGPESGPTP